MAVKRTSGPGAKILVNALTGLKQVQGEVGFFASARYEDGTPVAAVFVKNEFGYPPDNIPPRPTMRPTIAAKEKEWRSQFTSGAKAILAGNIDSQGVFESVSALAAGQMRKAIADIQSPSLSKRTVEERKARYARQNPKKATPSSLKKPLVDTKIMINSLTHKVT